MRDPEFFLQRYAPVTTAFSIVDISYDEVLPFWIDWTTNLQKMLKWSAPVEHIACSLTEKLDLLLPLDGQKRLLTETADGKIAVFSNMPHGDGSSDAAYLAAVFKKVRIMVTMTTPGMVGEVEKLGSTQFGWEDYGNNVRQKPGGQKHRSISAHKESRWEWHEGGDPFPWEEFETYKERRIKDRMTPEMVERYCRHFGIELFDPDYYAGRATLISFHPMLDRPYPQSYPNLKVND